MTSRYKCSRCREPGHNKNHCPLEPMGPKAQMLVGMLAREANRVERAARAVVDADRALGATEGGHDTLMALAAKRDAAIEALAHELGYLPVRTP